MRHLVIASALALVAACPAPEAEPPPPPPPPPPDAVPSIPLFVQERACRGEFDPDGDGTLDFIEENQFTRDGQLARRTLRDEGARTTSTEIVFHDAAGRERDFESVLAPDVGVQASYQNGHSTYDEAGRLVREELGGGDSRSTVVTRTTKYDDRGNVVETRDVASIPQAQSKTDTFIYDEQDRVVILQRDLGNDGSIDVTVLQEFDGLTTTATQDNPPVVTRTTVDAFDNLILSERDDGADGTIDRREAAQLADDGRILGYDVEAGGRAVSSTFTFDEAAKTQTVEITEAGALVARTFFDFGCLPFVDEARGACDEGFAETEIGCARWTLAPALDFGRQRHFATVDDDGDIVVLGGAGGHEGGVIIGAAERIAVEATDPEVVAAPEVHAGARYVPLADGRVAMVGGRRASVLAERVSFFEPGDLSIVDGPTFVAPRLLANVAALDDGTVLVAGGLDTDITASTEVFRAGDAATSPAPDMPVAVLDAVTLPLAGARALVLGGVTTPSVVASATTATQLFDAASATWSEGPALVRARSAFSAVLLEDDTVLVVGGVGVDREPIASVELLDLVAGASVEVAPLPVPLADAAAIALDGGDVLVAGGRSGAERDGGSDATFVFRAASGTWQSGPPLFVARSRAVPVRLPDGRVAVVGGAIHDLQATAAIEVLELAD